MTRIRERDLVIPALRGAIEKGGYIATSDLITYLEGVFEPDGDDAKILDGRHDTHFSQKVRNLISHRDGRTSMFKRGYAEYIKEGIQITDAGRIFLSQVPEFE